MNLDACKFTMSGTTIENTTGADTPSKSHFSRSVKEHLFQDTTNAKVLAFKQQAPRPKEGFVAEHKVLFTQNRDNNTRRNKRVLRHIPQTPERILDAPELKQDFYLNLLDWSSQNIIAVALAETVYLWDASVGSITELCTMPTVNEYVSSVSWMADGTHLAIGTADNTVQLWDVAREKKVRTMTGARGRIAAMDWNEHVLSTGSRHGTIHNHDVRQKTHHFQTLENHTHEICGLKWSPDGKYLASGGNDNIVNIWTGAGECNKTFTEHTAAVKALAWCPWQTNVLATGGGTADRTIRFWNASSGACLNSIDTKSQVSSLVWNKEHREIISGHGFSKNQLSIWSYPTMNKVEDLTGHTERVLSMAASPDGSTIVSAAADETLRFWKCFASDATKKKKTKSFEASASKLTATLR